MNWLGTYNYWMAIILMMVGLYCVIRSGNFVKKLVGLAIFQTSALLFYVAVGKVSGGRAPILQFDDQGNVLTPDNTMGEVLYANPLPHVLMLTAIVVGVALVAVGLAIVVRIKEKYGTVEEDEILEMDARPVPESSRLKESFTMQQKQETDETIAEVDPTRNNNEENHS